MYMFTDGAYVEQVDASFSDDVAMEEIVRPPGSPAVPVVASERVENRYH